VAWDRGCLSRGARRAHARLRRIAVSPSRSKEALRSIDRLRPMTAVTDASSRRARNTLRRPCIFFKGSPFPFRVAGPVSRSALPSGQSALARAPAQVFSTRPLSAHDEAHSSPRFLREDFLSQNLSSPHLLRRERCTRRANHAREKACASAQAARRTLACQVYIIHACLPVFLPALYGSGSLFSLIDRGTAGMEHTAWKSKPIPTLHAARGGKEARSHAT
jgi:hypothetical protein